MAASKKGASAWLTTLPIEEHGFALHKGAFRDALALCYGWPIRFRAEKCLCGAKFEPDHQMICRQGGYVSLRHNELRDLTASLMRKVCSDVSTEPMLQQVSGEHLPRSANKEDGARLDVRARGFWDCSMQDAFLMSEYSTRLLPATGACHYQHFTDSTRAGRRTNMAAE